MNKFYIIFLVTIICNSAIYSQTYRSIHKEQSEKYSSYKNLSEKAWNKNAYKNTKNYLRNIDGGITKTVFGWHPYWSGTKYYNYDFSLLTDISYFSYEVNPSTGSYSNIHDWKTTNLVDTAKKYACRINLAVTMFSGHSTFFSNQQSQNTLIDSLISLVKLRNANGVNIDFEMVPLSQTDNLTKFMIELSNRFHSEIPGSQISIALPAVDWSEVLT